MSYYTNVHVDLSDFNLKLNMNDDELNDSIIAANKEITKLDNELENTWILINALCIATPKREYVDIVRDMSTYLNDYIDKYKQCKHQQYIDELCRDMMQHNEWIESCPEQQWRDFGNGKNEYGETHDEYIKRIETEKQTYSPSVSFNNYEYSNDADEGLYYLNNDISRLITEIISLSVATPKDIYILNSEHGESGGFIIDEFNMYVDDKHEYLDELLNSLCFCILMIKYSNNITKG